MDKQQRLSRQEEMMSMIEKWHQSGKTQKLFCQEQNLAYSAFYYWLKRYRLKVEDNGFLPVEISSGSFIEIRYPGGVTLQLPAQVSLSVLKQLICL